VCRDVETICLARFRASRTVERRGALHVLTWRCLRRSLPPLELNRVGGEWGLMMPRYEFLCETCQKSFELIMTIAEREKAKPKCPTCKGTKVVPQFGGFMAQTSKKS
jgi:putative FmdB family regulatory protein